MYQCCVSFRCRAKWIDSVIHIHVYSRYMDIYSFSDVFPLEVTARYWVQFLVLYNTSLLFISYIHSSVYLLIPHSLIYPLPSFPFGNHICFLYLWVYFYFVNRLESSRKTSISALLTMPKSLTLWIKTNWKILRDGHTRPPDLPLEKSVCRSGSNS